MPICEGLNMERPLAIRYYTNFRSRPVDVGVRERMQKRQDELFFYGKEIQANAMGGERTKFCQCVSFSEA